MKCFFIMFNCFQLSVQWKCISGQIIYNHNPNNLQISPNLKEIEKKESKKNTITKTSSILGQMWGGYKWKQSGLICINCRLHNRLFAHKWPPQIYDCVSGQAVNVGVTMYVLSISSLSEVEMVLGSNIPKII